MSAGNGITVDGDCSTIDREDGPGTRPSAEVGTLHARGEGACSEAKEASAHGIGYGIYFTECRVQMDSWKEIGHGGCRSIPSSGNSIESCVDSL
jgi:hypothetical protein